MCLIVKQNKADQSTNENLAFCTIHMQFLMAIKCNKKF
jgi:hypothetical protein